MRLTLALALTVLGAACGASRAAAQGGRVQGTVRDAVANTPVPAAEVLLVPGSRRALTDGEGRFELTVPAEGEVSLLVRRPGYAPTRIRLEAASVTPIDVTLAPATTILDPVVTVATRDARSLAEVPAALAVADSTAIVFGRTAGLHEALRAVPGVLAASRSGGDDLNLAIRGSSGARPTNGVRGVAVHLDGVPLSEADGAARLDMIELSAARQVEVLRGPASALYGGAVGGVINVVSRTGAENRGLVARAQRGAFGFEKYDVYAGAPTGDGRGGLNGNAAYTWSEGFRDRNETRLWRAALRADYRPASRTLVAGEVTGSSNDGEIPGALTQAEFDADPDQASPIAARWGFGRVDERWRSGLRVLQGLGEASEASAYLYYGGRTLLFPRPQQVVELDAQRTQAGARARAARAFGAPLDLTAGVDYDILAGTDQRWQNDSGRRGPLRESGYLSVPNLGLYGQAEVHPRPDLDIVLGLRHETVQYRYQCDQDAALDASRRLTTLAPKVAVAWRPDRRSTVYATVARGADYPVIGEIAPLPCGAQNQSLEPRTLWNYEVGTKWFAGERLLLDAALFFADVRGEFISAVAADGTVVLQNAGQSRNVGVEFGVTWLATPWLDLIGAYTFSDFRLQQYEAIVLDATGDSVLTDFGGKLLPAVPQHRLVGEVRLRPLRWLQAGAVVEWQSRMFVENGNAVEGVVYARPAPGQPLQAVPFRAVPARALAHLNARATWGPTAVFVSLENVIGTRYTSAVTVNSELGRFYDAGAGRFLTVGLSLAGWPRGF